MTKARNTFKVCEAFGVCFYMGNATVGQLSAECAVPAWLVRTVDKPDKATMHLTYVQREMYVRKETGAVFLGEPKDCINDDMYVTIAVTLPVLNLMDALINNPKEVELTRLVTQEEREAKKRRNPFMDAHGKANPLLGFKAAKKAVENVDAPSASAAPETSAAKKDPGVPFRHLMR